MKNLNIGDPAMYYSCNVRVASSKLRGIAAPHYSFTCTNNSHEHSPPWGGLTSYQLLRPVKEEKGDR